MATSLISPPPEDIMSMDAYASNSFIVDDMSQYYIFVDAGSGATRAHLMYATMVNNETLKITEINSMASLALMDSVIMQAGLIRSINVLKAQHNIQKVKGIWLRATAGMRLLDHKTRERYIADIEFLLSNTFPNEFESAEIMSGEEEALFEWIQQNSVDGVFTHKHTQGAICVGGASVQVIFDSPPFPRPNIIAYKKTPILDAKMFYMYTHSWLGYGQASIIHTFMDEQRDKQRYKCGCLARNYDATKEEKYKYPGMTGSANFGSCLYAIEDFVAILDAQCQPPTFYDPCAFGDYIHIHDGIQFRATGKLGKLAFSATKALQLTNISEVRPGHFLEAAKIICEEDTTTSGHIPDCFSLIFLPFLP